MKLYYMPMACSLAPHIVANEAGLDLEVVRVEGKTKMTDAGQDSSRSIRMATSRHYYWPTARRLRKRSL
jgi:hypothetical protein